VDGGYVKPANQKVYCRDRRFARNQNGKRKVVVIVRERGGNSVPAVFNTESQAASFIRARVAKGTALHADEAGSWDNLHERFEVKRINHQEAYSLDGACADMAEEYFSRLRRAEIGIHHHIAGAYLLRYAQESSWREDNRRVSDGDQVNRIAALGFEARHHRTGLPSPTVWTTFAITVTYRIVREPKCVPGLVKPPCPSMLTDTDVISKMPDNTRPAR
jgi:hypothetical protein